MPVGFPDYYGGLTLPVTVAEGGTGQTSLALNGVLLGQGTSGVVVTAAGLANQVLQVPAAGGAPVFQTFNAAGGSLNPPYPAAAPGFGLAVGVAPAGANAAGVWIAVPAASTINPLEIVNSTITAIFTVSPTGAVTAASLSLTTPLPVASGGTGAASFSAANLPAIVAKVDLTAQTASIPSTALYTPATAAFYRVAVLAFITDVSAVADSIVINITYTKAGTVVTEQTTFTTVAAASLYDRSDRYHLFPDAGTVINYSVTVTTLGVGDTFDVHLRLEAMY